MKVKVKHHRTDDEVMDFWDRVAEAEAEIKAAQEREAEDDTLTLAELDCESVGELAEAYKSLMRDYAALTAEYLLLGERTMGYEEAMELFLRRVNDEDGVGFEKSLLMFKRRLREVAQIGLSDEE